MTAYEMRISDWSSDVCSSDLGLLTVNALVAAHSILVPLQCEFFALEGLSQLLKTVERVRARFNNGLTVLGVALTMFDRRNRLSDQIGRASCRERVCQDV